MVFEKVVSVLAEYKGCDVSEIAPDTSFEELGFDSLDAVEIAMSLEDEFGISLNFDESVKTVKDVVELIEARTEEEKQ